MRGRQSVIPAGQDELLRRMLDPPEGLPEGWLFDGAEVGPERALARYRRDSEVVNVELVRRDAAGPGALRTESFAILDAMALPDDLARAIEISVLAREHRVRWTEPEPRAPLDPAWIALESGVVSAIRISVPPELVLGAEQRFLELGAVVARFEAGEPAPSGAQTVLFVSRHASDAERARDLQRRLKIESLALSERRTLSEELGWALGFPSCCVAAFAQRVHPGVLGVVGSLVSGRVGNGRYRAARDAWVAAPEPRLNPFLKPVRRSLIDFEPCRFDCAHALEQANRVAKACAVADREWLADTERRAAEPIVIAPSGAISIVHLERRIEPMRIVGARPLRSADRAPSDEESELATQLIGAETRDDGFLAGPGTAWCLLVDFGARSTRRGSDGAPAR